MHIPVLLDEVIDGLALKRGDVVLDATVGNGGHAKYIAEKIGDDGMLIGIDEDNNALREAKNVLKNTKTHLLLEKDNFKNLDRVLKKHNIKKIDKALFDLGLRSDELEHSGRGFSFKKDEPLLMTFNDDATGSLTAYEILRSWQEKDIARILKEYGEERYARQIASGIIKNRKKKIIESTKELVRIIEESIPKHARHARLHFATKTFQALRIAVNDELESLKDGLRNATQLLSPDGRIAVISFHSLEDRIVKKFFVEKEQSGEWKRITKKPIVPTDEEREKNTRARSAKLRVLQNQSQKYEII